LIKVNSLVQKATRRLAKRQNKVFPCKKAEGSCKRQGTDKGPTIFAKGK
jgi:hypothetical protein